MDDKRLDRRTLLKGAAAGIVGAVIGNPVRAATPGAILDVVVIGAGISGLTAARDLQKAGLEKFIVLEARDRVGGRTLNADIGKGYVVEAGGQWIGRTQTAVVDLARELDIELFLTYNKGKTAFVADTDVSYLDANEVVDSGLAKRLDALAQEVPLDAPWRHPRAKELDAMTFADWLKTQNIPEDQQWGIRTGAILTFGAPPEQLSFLWVLFYTHSAGSYAELEGTAGEGAQALRVTGGSQALSLAMARALGDRVHLNTQVARISRWDGKGPCVVETNSGAFRAKRVIMALSPSQAALVDFDPGLPAQRAALQDGWPKISDMTKAAVVYETPFWREAGFSGQSFTLDGGAYLFAWDNSPPDAGVGVLSCFVPVLPDAPPASHKTALIDTYVKCFGPKAGQPINYNEHDWMPERYTRGCVSPLGPGLLTREGSTLRTTVGCLEWAGSETALIWNGYMDGAVRAGHDAALRALRAV